MIDTLVTLGGFVFAPGSFAVPEAINGGGRQALKVHRMIGGVRVIDAMGFNPDQIRMTGRFRGALASVNCRLVETIVRSGNMVVFSYWTNRYQVVGSQFLWKFERFYEITWELTLTVLADLTQQAFAQITATLDSLFDSDDSLVSTAASLLPTVNTALAAVATARAAVGTLQGASPATLLPLVSAVGVAATAASTAQSAADAAVAATAGGTVAGGNPAVMATSVTTQATNMQANAAAVLSSGVLTRMSTNLATAPQ